MGCCDRIYPASKTDAVIQGLPKAAATLACAVMVVALLIILIDYINGKIYPNPTIFKPASVDVVWAFVKWSGVAAIGCVGVSFLITSCYTCKHSRGKYADDVWGYFRSETLRSFCFPCTICR